MDVGGGLHEGGDDVKLDVAPATVVLRRPVQQVLHEPGFIEISSKTKIETSSQ